MVDPITGILITRVIGGVVSGALAEQKKEAEREARAQEMRKEVIVLVVKGAISIIGALAARKAQRAISQRSDVH